MHEVVCDPRIWLFQFRVFGRGRKNRKADDRRLRDRGSIAPNWQACGEDFDAKNTGLRIIQQYSWREFTAMTSPKQRAREADGRQDFKHSLQILDGISSWQLWSSALLILLTPPVLALVSFQSQLANIGLIRDIGPNLIVRASL